MPDDTPRELTDELTGALRKALVELGALIPTSVEEVELVEKRITDGTTPEGIESSFNKLEGILDDESYAPAFMQLHESVVLPKKGSFAVAARNGANLKPATLAEIKQSILPKTGRPRRAHPKLAPAREAEILELSEDVAKDDCISGRVCPARICTAKSISIVHDRFGAGNFDGMLVYEDRRWIVLCNSDTGNSPGSTRERFTLAHELGHFHIREHRRELMAGRPPHGSKPGAFDGAESTEELEADTFAANLLMPPTRFVPRLRSLKQSPLPSAATLRKEFDTSLESTAIQTMRHDSRVVAIAKWSSHRLAWHRISETFFRDTGYRQFQFRENDELPRDCATATAFQDSELQFDAPVREAVVTAAFCFGHVTAGSKRDILLREEAVRNGRFGVVAIYSILSAPETKRPELNRR